MEDRGSADWLVRGSMFGVADRLRWSVGPPVWPPGSGYLAPGFARSGPVRSPCARALV